MLAVHLRSQDLGHSFLVIFHSGPCISFRLHFGHWFYSEERGENRRERRHERTKTKTKTMIFFLKKQGWKNSILKSHGQGVVEKEAAGYFLLFQKSYPDDNRWMICRFMKKINK